MELRDLHRLDALDNLLMTGWGNLLKAGLILDTRSLAATR